MLSLKQALAQRTHRDLEVLAHLHGLPFTRRIPKAQSLKRLHAQMQHTKTVHHVYQRLPKRAKEALHVLKANGNHVPWHIFTRTYGDIRPYRPWQGDEAPEWHNFVSITEALWRLGMIEIQAGACRQVVLLNEVRQLLHATPLPTPSATYQPSDMGDGRTALLRDLTEWLAVASSRPIRLKKGRWLPVDVLRRINAGCMMRDDMTDIRGETRTIRLRWLHYLADVAGLICHTPIGIQLTVRGWEWLNLTDTLRWEQLLHGMWDDWRCDAPLWHRYHLPNIHFGAWEALYRHVVACDAGMYGRDEMVAAFRPYLALYPAFMPMDEADNPIFTIADAYWDVLAWLGIIENQSPHPLTPSPKIEEGEQNPFTPLHDNAIYITPILTQAITPAPLRYADDALFITRPTYPHPSAWVQLCAYAIPHDETTLRADADAIRRAIGIGETIPQIAHTIRLLIGTKLPLRAYEQLEKWGQQAHQQTLQTVTLLTVADTNRLQGWRADWRLSKCIEQVISAHHAVIKGDAVAIFTRKLHRRGHAVLSDGHLSASSDKHREALWLAVRVYQGISGFAPQVIRIPNAVRHGIADGIPQDRLSALEASAKAVIDRIGGTIKGYPSAGIIAPEADEIHIRTQVHAMRDARGAVKIAYFSPAYGERTTRIIEPVMIYERNGAEYVEAWCRRDEAMRLFRMDRILRIDAIEATRTGHPF